VSKSFRSVGRCWRGRQTARPRAGISVDLRARPVVTHKAGRRKL